MRYTSAAETDIGTTKETNQDSLVIRHANTPYGEVFMAIVCDGMGGLDKGELASATVIRMFSDWFQQVLPTKLAHFNWQESGKDWCRMLYQANHRIQAFGERYKIRLGTTFSGILMFGKEYLIVHVGDSRVYQSSAELLQLTEDQTFVAREVRLGNMTPEQAKTDRRRNVLLQCVGASPEIEPQVLYGTLRQGMYMLCSDGFRHELSEREIASLLQSALYQDKTGMNRMARQAIETIKSRGERDNISVILIRVEA